MKRILLFLIPIVILASCDFLEPRPIQDQTTDDLWSVATYGEGILTNAYASLQASYPITMDYYTDNAVPSQPSLNNLAKGSWTVESNPIGNWDSWYNSLRYLNLFIDNAEELTYSVSDQKKDSVLKVNRVGEAYFLRAWYQWLLLQNYGGYADGGTEALGFPIVNRVLDQTEDLDLPRNSYQACVDQIVSDCDMAASILPVSYKGSDNLVGIANRGRGSALGALALKARALLYAASPAYGPSSQQLWERAAEAAYDAIELSGGLSYLDDYGNFNDPNSFDHIWIQPAYSGNALEQSHYPPSLYGDGLCNPSQDLVDAFSDSLGYPISISTEYDPAEPYAMRDPRFYRFIFFNGDSVKYDSTFAVGIQTYDGGNDAPGGLSQQGTRTGYYMKKLTSQNVKLIPGSENTDVKFYVYLGKTELYLNFAEAANNAYGPDVDVHDFSAADAMKRVRRRAGIDSNPATTGYNDDYLDDKVAEGQEAFADFIQNERRVELCFEGFRFWDMRRLNMTLSHPVQGVKITDNGGTYTYTYQEVETHTFQDYMRYIPLPYDQILIMDNLQQNSGW